MSRFLFVFIITSFFISCGSFNYVDTPYLTNAKYKNKYNAFLEESSVLKHYGYHYTVEDIPTTNLEIVKYFHPEKMVMTHFITQNSETKSLEGLYTEWYDDGTVWKTGRYENNLKEGIWTIDSSEGNFEKNKKEGIWTIVDDKGRFSETVRYLNDEEIEDSRISYDTLGNIIPPEIQKPVKGEMDPPERLPLFPGCEHMDGDHKSKNECAQRKMLQYIYKSIKYPSIARENSLQGTALFKFIIEKDGSIEEITVLRGLCKEIETQCISIIENMGTWTPGYQKGKPVRVQFKLPVKFKLE